jgi:hypothetical protein
MSAPTWSACWAPMARYDDEEEDDDDDDDDDDAKKKILVEL